MVTCSGSQMSAAACWPKRDSWRRATLLPSCERGARGRRGPSWVWLPRRNRPFGLSDRRPDPSAPGVSGSCCCFRSLAWWLEWLEWVE
ncbi:hypothetical protein E2C01_090918 [Portunus trituberculatus]|uniref:Uncharacterized protein n=1 Tax=Portunus trituberculatus TaxID=210409 RepID=A0A5B7JM59_PORTR|nr:hypothetical protein [Portunus trituberculatus]